MLITELCQHTRVLRDGARDFEVTHLLFSYIRLIEAEYTREEDDRMRATLVDTYPEVDIDSIPIGASLATMGLRVHLLLLLLDRLSVLLPPPNPPGLLKL